jgi:hypothetical protein
MNKRVERERRDFTPDEKRQWEEKIREIERLNVEIESGRTELAEQQSGASPGPTHRSDSRLGGEIETAIRSINNGESALDGDLNVAGRAQQRPVRSPSGGECGAGHRRQDARDRSRFGDLPGPHGRRGTGLSSWCPECHREAVRAWRRLNRDGENARRRARTAERRAAAAR